MIRFRRRRCAPAEATPGIGLKEFQAASVAFPHFTSSYLRRLFDHRDGRTVASTQTHLGNGCPYSKVRTMYWRANCEQIAL
jgi:hypothetical protein